MAQEIDVESHFLTRTDIPSVSGPYRKRRRKEIQTFQLILKLSGSRNWHNVSVSGFRNGKNVSVSAAENWNYLREILYHHFGNFWTSFHWWTVWFTLARQLPTNSMVASRMSSRRLSDTLIKTWTRNSTLPILPQIKVNNIYQCHIFESQVRNLFSKRASHFESTFKLSIRIMAGHPYQTHIYLIETLLETEHVKVNLIRN